MDHFNEQIVKQNLDGKRIGIIAAAAFGAVLICAAVWMFLPWMTAPIIALCGFGLYWVATSQSWEVEYAVTNGDIDIDRIVARRNRKTIVRVSGEKIDRLLPVSAMPAGKHFDRVVMAAQSMNTATWCFTYHSKKNGSTVVYFEPSEELLDNLKKGLCKTVRMETERALRQL